MVDVPITLQLYIFLFSIKNEGKQNIYPQYPLDTYFQMGWIASVGDSHCERKNS